MNSYFLTPFVLKNAPSTKLSVRFSSEEVDLGNKIPAYSASIPPYIHYPAEPGELYTIIMVDVDTPCAGAPVDAQFVHAIIVNIQSNNLAKGDYLTCYYPVTPYPGSGYHRYVIVLYKQTKKIDVTTPEMQNRHKNLTNFSMNDFASRYGLGECIAANFFLSQTVECDNDQYTYKQCAL
ncbi:protein D2-like [Maniola hyperantus]|uniref:protein D2-like n=1 Tax=Aphantopus hyperantus TaxID=2795564 RepID=UPI003749347C